MRVCAFAMAKQTEDDNKRLDEIRARTKKSLWLRRAPNWRKGIFEK
jgi:hypothetical protein